MIIAVDFDGILAFDQGRFPEIGPPIEPMVQFIRELTSNHRHEVVLWTSRTDAALEDAVKWCEDRGLRFCTINENAPSNMAKYAAQYPNGTRKVSADVYIDDHDPHFQALCHDVGKEAAIYITIGTIRRIIKWKEEN